MLYAFPEQPYLAVIRVITGVVIGIVAGIILKLAHLETSAVIQGSRYFQTIGKDILDLKFEGTKGKIEAVFAGAKSEFFRVSKYVIIGALVSAILQTILPQTLMHSISSNPLLQFMIMVAAAILMSTCSTSNAFIGKSFSNNFSTIPILAFVVMGPMLDLKNMLMLSGVLKKRFLIVLATLVILEGAVVFSTLAYFL
jgi:Predicted permeases